MRLIFGLAFTCFCFVLGFVLAGGKVQALWQPYEFIMIFGAGIGYLIATNDKKAFIKLKEYLGYALKNPYDGELYKELLLCLYKLHELKINELEDELANPASGSVFSQHPRILNNVQLTNFISSNWKMLLDTDRSMTSFSYDDLLTNELRGYAQEEIKPYKTTNILVESYPAIGIMAAVLGITNALQYLDAEPMILGYHLSAALFGTFFGIFLAYAIFKPIATVLAKVRDDGVVMFAVTKAYLLAVKEGHMRKVAVLIANRDIPLKYRMSQTEATELMRTGRGA